MCEKSRGCSSNNFETQATKLFLPSFPTFLLPNSGRLQWFKLKRGDKQDEVTHEVFHVPKTSMLQMLEAGSVLFFPQGLSHFPL